MINFEKYSTNKLQLKKNIPALLLKLTKRNRFGKIADLGCGDGVPLLSLQENKLLDLKSELWGIDISFKRLARARKYVKNIKPIKMDLAKKFNLPQGYFDLIIASQIIEHLPDDSFFLKEVKKVLTQDGHLFISTVVKRKNAWWIYKNKNGERVCDPTHVREYSSVSDFIKLLKKTGFKIVETKSVPFFPSIINALIRMIVKFSPKSEPYWRKKTKTKICQFLNKVLRVRAPGYYVLEVIVQKK